VSREQPTDPCGIHPAGRSSLGLVMINNDRSAQAVPPFPLSCDPWLADVNKPAHSEAFLGGSGTEGRVKFPYVPMVPLEGWRFAPGRSQGIRRFEDRML